MSASLSFQLGDEKLIFTFDKNKFIDDMKKKLFSYIRNNKELFTLFVYILSLIITKMQSNSLKDNKRKEIWQP
jgi:hypothetical protein